MSDTNTTRNPSNRSAGSRGRRGAVIAGLLAITLEGDPRLIRRAIRNLLENGTRHGTAPLEVTVSPGSGGVDVRVDDAGAGVLVEHRLRIFDPFYRPEGLERGVSDGAGLGLYLVSQIAQVHGGRVDCSAGPTGGARFTLTVRTGSTLTG